MKPLGMPLLVALKTMLRWLERDGADRLMVAAHTVKEFKSQPLPAHLRTSIKKRQSVRVASKGPRFYKNTSVTLARWPEDGQEVNSLPALTCVLSGYAEFHIADYVVHCQPGDVLFFPAGVPQPSSSRPHYLTPYEGKSCELFWMCPGAPDGHAVECWICHSHDEDHYTGDDDEVAWVRNDLLVKQFFGLAEELRDDEDHKLGYYLLSGILLLTQREIERGHVLLPGRQHDRPADPGLSHDPVEQACSYIKSHLNQSLSISRIARQIYLSPSSLTRKFREQTGRSLTEYINAIRLEEAKTLLHDTEWSINHVGNFVGLKPPRMRQLFQEHVGCSPTEFRRKKIS